MTTGSNTDSSADIVTKLRTFETLEYLSDDQLTALTACATQESFAAEQAICREGEPASEFVLILGGEVAATLDTPLGGQHLADLGAGDLFGEISLLDGKPRSSSVVACSAGELARIDFECVSRLLADDPRLEVVLLQTFCRSLARKVREANDAMTRIMAPEGGQSAPNAVSNGERGTIDEAVTRDILKEHGISESEMEVLLGFLEAERFSAGDVIFAEGSPGDTLYLVADGRVRISRRMPGLGEEALAILRRGEIFGEMAWIDASPRSADAIAHDGGCTVLGISRRRMEESPGATVKSTTRFLRVICEILCRRIRVMNNQLVAWRTMSFQF